MYLKRITIKNIKCFSDLELDFAPGNRPRLWTAILGRNGLGKSTLLQAIAAALAGPWSVRELMPVAEGWVRTGHSYGEIETEIIWTDGDAQTPHWPKKKSPYIARYIVTGSDPEKLPPGTSDRPLSLPPLCIIDWSGEGTSREREQIAKDMSRLKQTAYAEGREGWLACGYGPFRRLSGGAQDADRILYSGRKSARFVTLFREDAALTDATEWLISLYNRARDEDNSSQQILDQIKSAFSSEFLPDPSELMVNSHSALLKIKNRYPVPFQDLSDGYRSMLALGIDLLRWIATAFPSSTNLSRHSGIVLIDELDAHAHPAWQREVGFWLRRKFPNLQFIIATHSPFLAQVADDAQGYIVLENVEGEVQVRRDVDSVATWRVDQILTELFDLPTTRSPEVERKIDRLQQLLQRDRVLTPIEREEYQQLKLWSDSLIPGVEDIAERKLAQTLQATIDRLSDKIRAIR